METPGCGLSPDDGKSSHSRLPRLGTGVTETHALGKLILAPTPSSLEGPEVGYTIGESGGPGVKSRPGAFVM